MITGLGKLDDDFRARLRGARLTTTGYDKVLSICSSEHITQNDVHDLMVMALAMRDSLVEVDRTEHWSTARLTELVPGTTRVMWSRWAPRLVEDGVLQRVGRGWNGVAARIVEALPSVIGSHYVSGT